VAPSFSARLVVCLLALGGLLMGQTELVGSLTRQQILEKIPDWKPFVEAYSPDLGVIARLQTFPEEVRVEIFLGTWCPDCRQIVSAYFKIEDMAGNPLIKTTLIGVPKDRPARAPYIAGRDIERVPTFIVHLRGREVGRIVETPRVSVEADLWRILEAAAAGR